MKFFDLELPGLARRGGRAIWFIHVDEEGNCTTQAWTTGNTKPECFEPMGYVGVNGQNQCKEECIVTPSSSGSS